MNPENYLMLLGKLMGRFHDRGVFFLDEESHKEYHSSSKETKTSFLKMGLWNQICCKWLY
jgi:hypothetical protein